MQNLETVWRSVHKLIWVTGKACPMLHGNTFLNRRIIELHSSNLIGFFNVFHPLFSYIAAHLSATRWFITTAHFYQFLTFSNARILGPRMALRLCLIIVQQPLCHQLVSAHWPSTQWLPQTLDCTRVRRQTVPAVLPNKLRPTLRFHRVPLPTFPQQQLQLREKVT